MLVIKFEIWPHGSESNKELLGEAHLWNDGTSDDRPAKGNYQLALYYPPRKLWRKSKVTGWKRIGNPWVLLCYALLAAVKGTRSFSYQKVSEIVNE